MSCDGLRDLDLAGVRWEITDRPLMAPAPVADTSDVPPVRSDSASVIAELGRGAPSVVPPIAPTVAVSLDTVRAMAARPSDMATLNRMIGEFNHPLRNTATNTVLPHVGQGALTIVTDIPSSDDDATGNILSGPAGELLDKMLLAVGMSRSDVSIIPMVFWRTPGGRTPTREELDMSRPFIDRALSLLSPRVILTLGTLPEMELAGINLAKSHGEPVPMPGMPDATLIPIFHPNYLILKPAAKRDVWNALQNMQNILKSHE